RTRLGPRFGAIAGNRSIRTQPPRPKPDTDSLPYRLGGPSMSKGQAATKQKTTAARPGSSRASAVSKKAAAEPKKAAGSKIATKVEPKSAAKVAPKVESKITSKVTSKIAPKIDSKAEPKNEPKHEPKIELKKVSEEKGMASKVAVATKAKAKEQ